MLLAVIVLGLRDPLRLAQQPSRRTVLFAAGAASTVHPTSAAVGPAVDLMTEIGEISTSARLLQYRLRESGSARDSRRAVVREQPALRRLLRAMESAAPDLYR